MRTASLLKVVTVSFAALFGSAVLSVAPSAQAAAGTCKCNNGCHSQPGQCSQGGFKDECAYGYKAYCGSRVDNACGTSSVSCADCVCQPIEGFCVIYGGADYCDSGPPDTFVPDTFVPDTFVEDTFVPDTFVPDTFVPDTFVPDTFVPGQDTHVDDTFVPDTFVPDTFVPDTFVEDTFVPDTYVEDTYIEDTFVGDTCVPYTCPFGRTPAFVPGQCDPFCAYPCGTGEFAGKCPGQVGVVCNNQNQCVPGCLVTGCATGEVCSLGTGTCVPDDTPRPDTGVSPDSTVNLPDGFTIGDDGVIYGPDGEVYDSLPDTGSASTDSSITPTDGTVEDSTTPGSETGGNNDGSVDNDGGFVEPDPALGTDDNGGCGCSVPGQSSDTNTVLGAAALAAVGIVVARRRRKA